MQTLNYIKWDKLIFLFRFVDGSALGLCFVAVEVIVLISIGCFCICAMMYTAGQIGLGVVNVL